MAMPLIHGAVSGEEVKVFAAFGIPYFGTRGFGEDDGKGMVVMCCIVGFRLNCFVC